jgi:hypothetical protein
MSPENNTEFLKQCLKLIRVINIVAPGTRDVMARMEAGRLVWIDDQLVDQASTDQETAAGLALLAPADAREQARRSGAARPVVDFRDAPILGDHA